ncbi:MAG: hypothetical protein NWQ55_09890 [Salibacteraceae bacterium]|jgi:hypothetical protein|nr:hypothetical protein [Salibacteraceae bacterium]MDP4686722.1 hypothetical protein [Salibacteraceae bacterium]MDP4763845.1 hypothetical protein [Salibacteraceae bacterium]MDP4843354.1 hypothetical protein [Salibacteraceae bacterium]MDP4965374.1 hypothetical protein [Salibacteraceae bacterium]
MKLKYTLAVAAFAVSTLVTAQIPKFSHIPSNDDKQYEYKADAEVDRAGTGELMERLQYWGETHFTGDKVRAYQDPQNKNILLIDVEHEMPEAHFSVSRTHTKRKLKFQISMNCDKKNYTYSVHDLKYEATESYKKGDFDYNGLLSDFKSPTKSSVEEEVDRYMQELILSFKETAQIPIDDLKNPKPEEEEMEEEVQEEEELVKPETPEVDEPEMEEATPENKDEK